MQKTDYALKQDFIELVRNRRSVRDFTARAVEADKVALLKETALRAPSSRDIRPWEFVFVEERTLLARLAACKPHGAEFLAGAALAVAVCADETKSDVWVEDCSIAAVMLQFAAQSLGLGSCWVQVRLRPHSGTVSAEEYIRSLLQLPGNLRVLAVIGIGYPVAIPPPIPAAALSAEPIRSLPAVS